MANERRPPRKRNPVVPNRIREFRKAHGLPGIRITSHVTGINRYLLARAERGESNLADVDKIALLDYFSKALGRTVEPSEVFLQRGDSAQAPANVR